MNVKFKDGTIKNCTSPTEQKLFKSGEDAGWILNFALMGDITSDEVDSLITKDNISELTFISVYEETETSFSLNGYERTSSVIVRYNENNKQTRVEIQLMRGI